MICIGEPPIEMEASMVPLLTSRKDCSTIRAKNGIAAIDKGMVAASGPTVVKYRRKILVGFGVLLFLVFVRSWFHAGLANYYQFFAIEEYGMTISQAQVYLFIFLAAGAIGTFAGGPLADRFGKRTILMLSMLGSAPFALLLPHVGPILHLNGTYLKLPF